MTSTESGLPLLGWGVLTAAVAIGIGEVPASFPLWSFQVHARRWFFGGFTRSASALPQGLYWQLVRLLWPSIGFGGGIAFMAMLRPIDAVDQLP